MAAGGLGELGRRGAGWAWPQEGLQDKAREQMGDMELGLLGRGD